MREGSALLAALLLAAGVAYWSDHYRAAGPRLPAEHVEALPPPPPVVSDEPAPPPERLEVGKVDDPETRHATCEELLEVVRGVESTLLTPQSPATVEQLNARRRLYQEKRAKLGC